jgi:hypothetical protein
MSYKVFICYEMEDKLVADAACAALEARRIRCWISPRDILADKERVESIADRLDNCQIVLLIMSVYANKSELVRGVFEWAESQGKDILPLFIDDIESSETLKFVYGSRRWLDALMPSLQGYLFDLCNQASLLLEKQKAVEAPLWQPQQTAGAIAARPEIVFEPTKQEPVAKTIPQAIPEPVPIIEESVGTSAQQQSAEPHLSKAIAPPAFTSIRSQPSRAASESETYDELDEEDERTPFWTTSKVIFAVLFCIALGITAYLLISTYWQSPQTAQPAQPAQSSQPAESKAEEQTAVPFVKPGESAPVPANTQPSSESDAKPETAKPVPAQKVAAPKTSKAQSSTQKAAISNTEKGAKAGEGAAPENSLTWTDSSTGLMWAKKDSGSEHDLTWKGAAAYCKNLQLDGHSDWRLPTVDELEKIYDANVTVPGQRGAQTTTWHVKGNLELSGWQWSITPTDSPDTAWYFSFGGVKRFPSAISNSYALRALCVRGGKH